MQGGPVGTHPPLGFTEGGSEIRYCGCIALLSQKSPPRCPLLPSRILVRIEAIMEAAAKHQDPALLTSNAERRMRQAELARNRSASASPGLARNTVDGWDMEVDQPKRKGSPEPEEPEPKKRAPSPELQPEPWQKMGALAASTDGSTHVSTLHSCTTTPATWYHVQTWFAVPH